MLNRKKAFEALAQARRDRDKRAVRQISLLIDYDTALQMPEVSEALQEPELLELVDKARDRFPHLWSAADAV